MMRDMVMEGLNTWDRRAIINVGMSLSSETLPAALHCSCLRQWSKYWWWMLPTLHCLRRLISRSKSNCLTSANMWTTSSFCSCLRLWNLLKPMLNFYEDSLSAFRSSLLMYWFDSSCGMFLMMVTPCQNPMKAATLWKALPKVGQHVLKEDRNFPFCMLANANFSAGMMLT